MNKKEILELIQKNPVFFLATIDGQNPRVRGMLLYKADSEGIIFHTGKGKDLYNQIKKNPYVELCFNDFSKGIQARIEGILEEVCDNNLKDEISNHPTREFMKPWKDSISIDEFYDMLVVFKMTSGKAKVWTMKTNLSEKEYIDLF